jgi:hypothetical protein
MLVKSYAAVRTRLRASKKVLDDGGDGVAAAIDGHAKRKLSDVGR